MVPCSLSNTRPELWADRRRAPAVFVTRGTRRIRRSSPAAGWVQKYSNRSVSQLLELPGFCGWTARRLRGSSNANAFAARPVTDAHDKCCWYDIDDSRYHLLTASALEKWATGRTRGYGYVCWNFYDTPILKVTDP